MTGTPLPEGQQGVPVSDPFTPKVGGDHPE
jgi:hypothetical protein